MQSTEDSAMMAEEYGHIIEHFEANMNDDQCVPLDLGAVERLTRAYESLLDEKLGQIVDLEAALGSQEDGEHILTISSTLDRVRGEMRAICSDVKHVIDNALFRYAVGDRERVLICKFEGDFCRIMWAMNPDDIKSCEEASKAYFNALTICKWNFEPTDMHLLQTALNYSVHLNKANKFDEAIAILTGVINNAQEILHNNGDNEIIEKKSVQSILADLKNIFEFSKVNSKIHLAKFIEELESGEYLYGRQDFVDACEEELWNNVEEESWDYDDDEEELWDEVEKELWTDVEEKLREVEEDNVIDGDEQFCQITIA